MNKKVMTAGRPNLITNSVTSTGMSGEEWIARLENKGFYLDVYAKQILRSKYFQPTNGVTYNVFVITDEMFDDESYFLQHVWEKGEELEGDAINLEVACLLRDEFFDQELLSVMCVRRIVIMNKLAKDDDGDPRLFVVGNRGGVSVLSTDYHNPAGKCTRECGFAFESKQAAETMDPLKYVGPKIL